MRIVDPNWYPCGHPRTPQNSRISSVGYAECRECRKIRDRKWRAKRREEIRQQRAAQAA